MLSSQSTLLFAFRMQSEFYSFSKRDVGRWHIKMGDTTEGQGEEKGVIFLLSVGLDNANIGPEV